MQKNKWAGAKRRIPPASRLQTSNTIKCLSWWMQYVTSILKLREIHQPRAKKPGQRRESASTLVDSIFFFAEILKKAAECLFFWGGGVKVNSWPHLWDPFPSIQFGSGLSLCVLKFIKSVLSE